jgi:hypothetical protein
LETPRHKPEKTSFGRLKKEATAYDVPSTILNYGIKEFEVISTMYTEKRQDIFSQNSKKD